MSERRARLSPPREIPDYSGQTAIVGELIVAENAYQHAVALRGQALVSLATEGSRVAGLQFEIAQRAESLTADVLDFSRAGFDYESMGHRHPQVRGMASSPVKYTNSASREYTIDDNGQVVVYTVTNRRTTQKGKIVEESLVISKTDDSAFKLSMTMRKSGRNLEKSLDLRDGRGWQNLTQGSERQKWHGYQQYNPGQEGQQLTDVLDSFKWFMDRFHHPIQEGVIEDLGEITTS